jgi:predicted DCC family thiol-disulfide oxidoreductase YuxK
MNSDINELLKKQPILLFDGDCGFCNKSVLFFLARESSKQWARPERKMHFATLQSPEGMALKKYFDLDERLDSLILIRDRSAFIKSCAALRLTLYMRGLWPLMAVFVIIPPFMRNVVYHWVAARRMRLFGKVQNCAMLSAVGQSRFL